MKYLVDSNIFLRFAVPENKKMYEECRQFLALIDQGELETYATDLIIAEVQWVMVKFYKLPKALAVNTIETIVGQPNLLIYPAIPWLIAISIYEQKNVKFIDATTAAIIYSEDSNDWAVVSYDRDFDKLGVKRLEPKDILR